MACTFALLPVLGTIPARSRLEPGFGFVKRLKFDGIGFVETGQVLGVFNPWRIAVGPRPYPQFLRLEEVDGQWFMSGVEVDPPPGEWTILADDDFEEHEGQ